MRILFIHNYYQQRGGEDTIFEQEVAMLREAGIPVETIEFTNDSFDGTLTGNLTGALRSIYNRKSITRLETAIKIFKPSVVHIHNLFYTASPAVIHTVKKYGIPVVMTLHNYRLVCAGGLLMRKEETPCERCLTKRIPLAGIRFGCFRESRLQTIQLTAITTIHKFIGTWKSVNKYIVLTDFAKNKILQSSLNLSKEQITVKPNYVADLGYVSIEDRENFYLFLGRLSEEKGIKILLEAAKNITHPIVIIGDGPLQKNVIEAAAKFPHITYLGKQSREVAVQYLKKCKAMIFPSICYEGLPTTILEAFATGTIVLCSDQNNLNSIVRHSLTGILFKTKSSESIVKAIEDLEKYNLKSISKSCFKEYNENYTTTRVLENQLKNYESVTEP